MLALALALAALGTSARALPSADELLDSALAAPAAAYRGRVLVVQWYGRAPDGSLRTRASELAVAVKPPDRVRRELLAPDGSVERVLVSDGSRERATLCRTGRTVVAQVPGAGETDAAPEARREILRRNYELIVGTAAPVAGREVWRLSFVPKSAGKARLALWIDKDSKTILRVKRWLPGRPFARDSQFLVFEPGAELDDSLFRVDAATAEIAAAHPPSPLTMAELRAKGAAMPEGLPGGFAFESGAALKVRGSVVLQARYTDGLSTLSLFQTDRPVHLPKNASVPAGRNPLPGPLSASAAGKIMQWRSGRRHFVMMSDVSRALMGKIAAAVAAAR